MSNYTSPISEEAAPVHPEWTLGDRLRKARRLGGFRDQRSFAAVLGISHGSIANYEDDRTRPNRLVIREWARITGVDEEWIQPKKDEPGEAVRLDRRRRAMGPTQAGRNSTCNPGAGRVIPFPSADRPEQIVLSDAVGL
jgi:transcriptional regulator with XRE-family HTH domain